MNKALILHSVEDAQHCIENRLNQGNMLFSTHSSVDVYLKEVHNVDCQCLSKFLTTEEIINYGRISSDVVDRALRDLDSRIAPSINKQFDLKMRYFTPLYSYLGKYHFSGYVCFVEAVKRIIDIYKLKRISFYKCKFNGSLDVIANMEYFSSLFFNDLETELLEYLQVNKSQNIRLREFANIIKRNKQRPLYAIKKLIDIIRKRIIRYSYEVFSSNKKTILLYGGLYNLQFLKDELPKKYNVLYYGDNGKLPFGFKYGNFIANVNLDFKDFEFAEEKKGPFIQIFLKDIKEDFLRNISQYLKAIQQLKTINKKHSISLGIWGNPPVSGVKSLIFEYLRSEDIRIIGGQHGCLYGELFNLWQFDSDFNRCNYFLSYGFTQQDLNRLYPNIKLETKILPFGKAEPIKNSGTKKNIDILFPITNSASILRDGMMRIFPHKLTERQIKLLEYLNSLKEPDIYIKLFAYSTYQNCSVLPILKRLKNLKVIADRTLTKFLEAYKPRVVIIEYPSQPLFDVLYLDSEIFLMNDDIHPYGSIALEELKKRVHYSEDINEIITKLDLFLKGKLKKKRDNTFYNHYVHKENRKKNVLRFIDLLVKYL
ncbi:MAG: hypothetical protein ISS45_00115 [Candidatus Omnitrophica bacterium]|nr:hypothetical protein [Candidatus Omnitrophota bacterium]